MRLSESLGAGVQKRPVKSRLVIRSDLGPVLIRVFSLVLFKTGVLMNEMASCNHGWAKVDSNESARKRCNPCYCQQRETDLPPSL